MTVHEEFDVSYMKSFRLRAWPANSQTQIAHSNLNDDSASRERWQQWCMANGLPALLVSCR